MVETPQLLWLLGRDASKCAKAVDMLALAYIVSLPNKPKTKYCNTKTQDTHKIMNKTKMEQNNIPKKQTHSTTTNKKAKPLANKKKNNNNTTHTHATQELKLFLL